MSTPIPRPAAALARHAAGRWPAHLQDRLLREWQAELAALAASGGPRWWRSLRALRFAGSLAVRRPDATGDPLPLRSRTGREVFAAAVAVAAFGTAAALALVHLPALVADRLPGPDPTDGAHRWPLLFQLPALLAVGWLSGRRLSRRDGPRDVTRTVVAVVLGLALVRLSTAFGDPVTSLPGTLAWTAGMFGAAHVAARLARRPRGPLPWIALALGGIALADLAVTASVWLSVGAAEAPRAFAASWFPAALLDGAVTLPMGPGAAAPVLDAVELMPHALLVTGAFLLTYVHAVSRREPQPALPA